MSINETPQQGSHEQAAQADHQPVDCSGFNAWFEANKLELKDEYDHAIKAWQAARATERESSVLPDHIAQAIDCAVEALEFYTIIDAKRGIVGTDCPAVIALANLLAIQEGGDEQPTRDTVDNG